MGIVNMVNIVAYDTETYKGYVKVLANSNGEFIESSNTLQLLDFLFRTSVDDGYNVFYNIGYDLASIIKEYLVANGDELHNSRFASDFKRIAIDDDDEIGYNFTIGTYKIQFLNDKMFSLKYGKVTRNFWDASNFYKSGYGHLSLDKAAEMYLGTHKINTELKLDRAKIGGEEGYYEQHRDDIIKYCISDAVLTKRLYEKTIKGFENLEIKFPEKPYSEASIFKEYLNPKWGKEKEFAEIIQTSSYFSIFHNAYRGGLFQTRIIGRVDDVYDVDINSAYPSVMSELYSVVDSEIVEGDISDCDYKFYIIKAHPNTFLPIKHGNRLYYGTSSQEFEFYVTEWDLKLLDLYNYPYTIINSVGVRTKKKLFLPELKEFYKKKFQIKKKYGNYSTEYFNIKIFLNSGYGVFAQSQPNYTKYTNFIYASYITAKIRYLIGWYIYINKDEVISISTDGILFHNTSDGEGKRMMERFKGEEMGQLTIEDYAYVVQYGNGIYMLVDNNGRVTLKKRGYESMTVDDLKKDVTELEFSYKRPMRMIEGIIQKKYKMINDFAEVKKSFSPFALWITINPIFAEQLFGYTLSDFMKMTMTVPESNLDDFKWMIADDK